MDYFLEDSEHQLLEQVCILGALECAFVVHGALMFADPCWSSPITHGGEGKVAYIIHLKSSAAMDCFLPIKPQREVLYAPSTETHANLLHTNWRELGLHGEA